MKQMKQIKKIVRGNDAKKLAIAQTPTFPKFSSIIDYSKLGLDILKRVTGKPEATWQHTVQRKSLEYVVSHPECSILLSGQCGSGKTAVALARACLSSKKTIWITCRVSIVVDQIERLKAAKLESLLFDPTIHGDLKAGDVSKSSVIFVYLHHVPQIIKLVQNLVIHDELGLVVLDEIHCIIVESYRVNDWHVIVSLLNSFTTVPIIGMSGTLDYDAEQKLRKLFHSLTSSKIFRGPSLRSKLIRKTFLVDNATDLVSAIQQQLQSLMDCGFIHEGITVAKKLADNCNKRVTFICTNSVPLVSSLEHSLTNPNSTFHVTNGYKLKVVTITAQHSLVSKNEVITYLRNRQGTNSDTKTIVFAIGTCLGIGIDDPNCDIGNLNLIIYITRMFFF